MPKRLNRVVPIFLSSIVLATLNDPPLAQSIAGGGKTCYVSKFKFENEGAYELSIFKVGSYTFDGFLSQGQSRTWDISKAGLENGTDAFLTYRIDQGSGYSRKSCKKDDTQLKYHPDGNTWGYWSKGSTRINNRCRFRSNTCIAKVD
ncbi:MAG: hypothetical protein AAFV37_00095 [Pseudomonadota bacterium]